MTACDHCVHGERVREEQFHCHSPVFGKRGRVIYKEMYGILKTVGCGSGEWKP